MNMFTCFVLVVVVLVTSPPTVSPLHPLRQHFLFSPTLIALLSCRKMLLWRLMILTNRSVLTSKLHRFGSMFGVVAAILDSDQTRPVQHMMRYVLISPSLAKLPPCFVKCGSTNFARWRRMCSAMLLILGTCESRIFRALWLY